MFQRKSTGYTNFEDAQRWLNLQIAENKDRAVHGPLLRECFDMFLESKRYDVCDRTCEQYALVFNRMLEFYPTLGIYHAQQLNLDNVERFKAVSLGHLKSTSRSTSVSKLKSFLGEAYRRGWITTPLAVQIKNATGAYDQKQPYTDNEVETILNESLRMKGGIDGYASEPGTFRLLLELMLETGMRASDAVLFDPHKLRRGELSWIYTFIPVKTRKHEQPKPVDAFIPDTLKDAIHECKWLSPSVPFSYGGKDYAQLAQAVYERMQAIGLRCDPQIEDCRPHRLRDTFAVRNLLAGVPIGDVSKLLGHCSVVVTERYYAPWIPERHARLERLVAQTRVDADRNVFRN